MSLILALLAAVPAPVADADRRPVFHYVRSNSDGSEAEDIVIFRRSDVDVHVVKMRDRCTDAAHVIATLDPATGQATRFVGGRLERDGGQRPMAWLDHDIGTRRLVARLGSEDSQPVADFALGSPWYLYDFDFADLIARPPTQIAHHADFAFEMPLLIVRADSFDFANRGEATLHFETVETHQGSGALRYRVGGAAFGTRGGTIWFAAAEPHHIVDAQLGLPNHAEYRDFRLRLVRVEAGEAAWQARIAQHWAGCS